MTFDPQAPLPSAPDPWAGSTMPERRPGPPYLMTEMITAEPAVAERVVRRVATQPDATVLAEQLRAAAAAHTPIITTGCGTSEHAAMAVAALLADALRAGPGVVTPVQAFELARRPPGEGVVFAVSHEGGTAATNAAIEAAGGAGATTALVTVSDRSPGAGLADLVVTTDEQDQSWCHTVGYLSPIVAGATLAGMLRHEPLDATAVRALLDVADDGSAAEAAAGSLASCERVLLAGSGIDHVAARELALKVEEGARLPATAHPLETVRHGHLAAATERTGFILVLTDGEQYGAPLLARALAVLGSARALRMPAVGIIGADLGDHVPLELTPGGRVSVPVSGLLPRLVGASLGSATPLQLLAERLARARGLDPDTIGREDPRQAAAAEA